MKLSNIVACILVLLVNNVLSQYITWNSNEEKDLSGCRHQLAIAEKESNRMEKIKNINE